MADFLLLHETGQGSWCWGAVWGHLTAPVEHPPRLYSKGSAVNVITPDLPGHGSRGQEDTSGLTLDDFVSAVTNEVESQGLRDLILVGHGAIAPILVQAATRLEQPPKRVVLFAGIIPDEGKSPVDMLPRPGRLGFNILTRLQRANGKRLKLPMPVITNLYCNGMDPSDVIQIVGRFCDLPTQLVRTGIYLDGLTRNFPITYVPLWRDRLLSSERQRRMAERLGGVEVVRELDSCHEVMIERPRQVADILLRYA